MLYCPGDKNRRQYSRKNCIETMKKENRIEKDSRKEVGSGDRVVHDDRGSSNCRCRFRIQETPCAD